MASVDAELDRIVEDATKLKPMRVFLTVVGAVPFVLLLLLRFVWLVPAFCISAGRRGWVRGTALLEQWQVQAREAQRR